MAKEAGWQTIVGGPEPGAYTAEYLEAGADVVVIGEGEVTVEELVLRSCRAVRAARTRRSARGIMESLFAVRMVQCAVRLGAQIADLDANPGPPAMR